MEVAGIDISSCCATYSENEDSMLTLESEDLELKATVDVAKGPRVKKQPFLPRAGTIELNRKKFWP